MIIIWLKLSRSNFRILIFQFFLWLNSLSFYKLPGYCLYFILFYWMFLRQDKNGWWNLLLNKFAFHFYFVSMNSSMFNVQLIHVFLIPYLLFFLTFFCQPYREQYTLFFGMCNLFVCLRIYICVHVCICVNQL